MTLGGNKARLKLHRLVGSAQLSVQLFVAGQAPGKRQSIISKKTTITTTQFYNVSITVYNSTTCAKRVMCSNVLQGHYYPHIVTSVEYSFHHLHAPQSPDRDSHQSLYQSQQSQTQGLLGEKPSARRQCTSTLGEGGREEVG